MRALALLLMMSSVAHAIDSDHIWSLSTDVPAADGTFSGSSTPNTMYCVRWIPTMGVQSATKIAWPKNGGTPGNGGVAIYSADGATRLATTGAIALSISNVNSVTGLSAFSLNASTVYTLCWCATGTSWSYPATPTNGAFGDIGSVVDMTNSIGTNIGTASNPCSSGAPPSTVGNMSLPPPKFRPMQAMFSKQ